MQGHAGVGTRHQPHSSHSCERALRAVGAACGCLGGAPLAWVWGVQGRVLSHPRPLVLSGVRQGPTTHWLWVRGVRAWGPVTNPTARALACSLCALWGRHEGARGGRLLPGCGASGVGCSPSPDLSSARACGRGPLPTGCGCGGCGRRDPSPTPQCAFLRAGFARCGGGMWVPGGAPPSWVWGVWGRASSHPRPLVLSGVRPRPTTHWLWVQGGGRGDPSPTPQRALLRAGFARCGGSMRVSGRAPLAWVWGVRGRAVSHPQPLVLSGVRPGPTTHCLWVPGSRAWVPVTNPTARALASWLCALWGRHEGARGARLLPGCGASGVWRSPTPDHSSFRACGRGPLPTGCGCGGCGRGDLSPPPQRALLRAGLARCGGGMRVPGGGASCLGVGRRGSGALPPPSSCPFGRAAGAHYPLAMGAGVAGVGTRNQPHSARSCEEALHAVEAACGCPGGSLLPGCGASAVGRSSNPNHSCLQWCGRGPLPTGCGCGGCGCGDPSPTPQRALLRTGFARCGGGMRVPGGTPTAWVWGVQGRALFHPRPLVLSVVRPGRTTHWLWVRGVRAWGPVTNPTARTLACWLFALWGRHEGPRRGRLLPACGASRIGRSPTPDLLSVRACGRGPLPTGCGCGGCGRGDPS